MMSNESDLLSNARKSNTSSKNSFTSSLKRKINKIYETKYNIRNNIRDTK